MAETAALLLPDVSLTLTMRMLVVEMGPCGQRGHGAVRRSENACLCLRPPSASTPSAVSGKRKNDLICASVRKQNATR